MVATFQHRPAARTTGVSQAAAVPPVTADRGAQHADRSEQRLEAAPQTTPSAEPSSPNPSPSRSPKPSKSGAAPKPPTGGGTVVDTGTCQASFYTDEGNHTANGEIFHVAQFTAAHKTLPFNTRVRVTNTKNGKSVVVRINDRGPFVAGRCLDLTPAAFNTISSTSAGVASVSFEVLSG
jgi:rare lipoprotein A